MLKNNLSKMSVKEIKILVDSIEINEEIIDALIIDSRKSVNRIASKIQKQLYNQKMLLLKYERMNIFEKQGYIEGFRFIAGIDEAGRGPLAGPVVAAAVILSSNQQIIGLDDSKKLSESKRNELYKEIQEKAISIGIGIVDNNMIDEINILNSAKEAMLQAVGSLNIKPDLLLIDAITLDLNLDQKNIIKGDQKSNSIAAASIIAKVTRDEMMKEFSKIYPDYSFEQHKGYGTKIHYERIQKYGITKIHRKSFLKNMKGDQNYGV